ncbi:MAG: toll/interleukin-1 receptor domain-containing protein [Promethearchaeota archaeon]
MILIVDFISMLFRFLITIFGLLFGSLFLYKSKKLNIKILLYAGLSLFFVGLFHILVTLDALLYLFTDIVVTTPYIIVLGLNQLIFYGASGFFIIYVGGDLLFPKKKWLILSIYLVGSILLSPILLILMLYVLINIASALIHVFIAFLFLTKSIQYHGVLKRKFIFLSIAYIIESIGIIQWSFIWVFLIDTSIGEIINSSANLVFVWFFYYGLKPGKSFKRKKMPSPEEVRLTSYMLGKPIPAEIAEEELKQEISSIQIEKKIKKPILIFISYATKDAEYFNISEISEGLTVYDEIKDVLYWQEDVRDNIIEYMNENLKKCDVMILFCSENALKSVPVKKEWTAADIMGMPIIPVFTDPNYIPPILRSRLGYEFNSDDIQTNVQELYGLALKKCEAYYEFK